MPNLETERLLIREFSLEDLDAVYQILDIELADAETGSQGPLNRERRRRWLEWSALNYENLAWLYQPPYGDRAVILKSSAELIGACGLVPLLDVYGQLPYYQEKEPFSPPLAFPEVGLYYALSPRFQGKGYATEAARALVEYGFSHMRLRRIVATTTYDNQASMAVMRRLGMRVETNPHPEPPWLQVLGILENNLDGWGGKSS